MTATQAIKNEAKQRLQSNGFSVLSFAVLAILSIGFGLLLFTDIICNIISILITKKAVFYAVNSIFILIMAYFSVKAFSFLSFGLSNITYKLACGNETALSDLFICFYDADVRKKRNSLFTRTFLAYLIAFLRLLLVEAFAVYIFLSIQSFIDTNRFLNPVSVLKQIPEESLISILILIFAIAFIMLIPDYIEKSVRKYFLLQYPELSVKDIILMSNELYSEQHANLFKLLFSHIGSLLLSALVIPAFYYLPYFFESYAVSIKWLIADYVEKLNASVNENEC